MGYFIIQVDHPVLIEKVNAGKTRQQHLLLTAETIELEKIM